MATFYLGSGSTALAMSTAQNGVEAFGGTFGSYIPLGFVVITLGLIIAILMSYIAYPMVNLGRGNM